MTGLRSSLLAALGTLLALVMPVRAHPAVSTVAVVRVDSERHISVTLTHDALAYALNDTSARITDAQMYELLDAPDQDLGAALADGRERFTSAFGLFADGAPIPFQVVETPTV